MRACTEHALLEQSLRAGTYTLREIWCGLRTKLPRIQSCDQTMYVGAALPP